MLRVVLFLLIPFAVYLSSTKGSNWLNAGQEQIYDLSYGVLALFAILTLRFTRRKAGFQTTPMDILILLFALILPNIPDPNIRSQHMGIVTAKIIVLFFCYDVLMGELRGKGNGRA